MKKMVRIASAAAGASAALFLAGCSTVDLGPAQIVDRSSYGTQDVVPVTTPGATLLPGGVRDSGRTHTVAPGDTLYNISVRHGLDPQHLAKLNMISDPTQLRIGQVLHLPESVSEPREYVPNAAVRVNRIAPDETLGGMPSVAPAQPVETEQPAPVVTASPEPAPVVSAPAQSAQPAQSKIPAVTPGQRMIWPVRGKILSDYAQNRMGLDIAATRGDVVVSAMQGEVILVGFLKDYGNLVIVKHAPTLVTAYGHVDGVVVKQGTKVKSGQKIAEVDAGGKLRFEVRDKGKPVDPMGYLNKR